MIRKLIKFTEIRKEMFEEYISEWQNTKEKIVPASTNPNGKSFEEMLEKWLTGETEKSYEIGFVPNTLYFLIDENFTIIGALSYRYVLNDKLMKIGGHIGFGIRPTKRNKGNGKFLLHSFLEMIQSQNVEKVLLTCDDDNIASSRIIEACGGELEKRIEHDGILIRHYWIKFI